MRQVDLTPMTSHFYGFTWDNMIPKGIIKIAVTLGEPPRTTIVVIDFLSLNYPSAFNRVLGRQLLKALKEMISIHCLKIKFPTTAGTSHV